MKHYRCTTIVKTISLVMEFIEKNQEEILCQHQGTTDQLKGYLHQNQIIIIKRVGNIIDQGMTRTKHRE